MLSSETRALAVVAGKLTILLLPVLLLLINIEAGLRRMPSIASGKRTIADARASQTDVLILGSSHALHGISPRLVSPHATSLASFSQDLYYDDALLRAYIDRMPRLKLVVAALSYFSFRYQLSNSPEHWRGFFYREYFGIPEEVPLSLWSRWDPRRYSFLYNYGLRASFAFLRKGFRNDLGLDQAGWMPISPRDTSLSASLMNDAAGLKKVMIHNSEMRGETVTPNRIALEHILTVLRTRCVSVVVVMPPVFSTYWRHLDPGISRETSTIAATLTARHGAYFRDYQKDTRFTLEDFDDSDHLNARGAGKLTTILVNELITPVLSATVSPGSCRASAAAIGDPDGASIR